MQVDKTSRMQSLRTDASTIERIEAKIRTEGATTSHSGSPVPIEVIHTMTSPEYTHTPESSLGYLNSSRGVVLRIPIFAIILISLSTLPRHGSYIFVIVFLSADSQIPYRGR